MTSFPPSGSVTGPPWSSSQAKHEETIIKHIELKLEHVFQFTKAAHGQL
jgi:hypothetical protein